MNTTALFHVSATRVTAAATAQIIDPTELSNSIQWMPPGRNEISASVGGKSKKVTVVCNEQTAQLVDRRIKEMIAAAASGSATLPYIDFNHDDAEAAGWPSRAWWGGSDALTGGVRLNVEWSAEGKAKVKGKSFQGFSPEFLLAKDGLVVDVGINLGGLVNKPAFTAIQRVTAHAVDDSSEETALVLRAAWIKAERGITEDIEAISIAARENNDLYRRCHGQIIAAGAGSEALPGWPKPIEATTKPDVTGFTVEAKKMAEEQGLDICDAMRILASERPALYHQYHASLGLDSVVTVQAGENGWNYDEAEHQPFHDSSLLMRAKEIATIERVDFNSAIVKAAQECPMLYEEYREALIKPR